jgi:hypothetical protein
MFSVIIKSLKDIFSPTVLSFILKVGLGSFVAVILFLYMIWDKFSAFVSSLIASIPYIGSFSFIQEGSSFLVALVVAYTLVIVVINIVTSFYSPKVIMKLAKKHYPYVQIKDESKITSSLYYTLKATIIFLILFVLFLPIILFVPVLGQIVMLFLWAILLKEPTFYDVSSLFSGIDKQRLQKAKSMWIIALIAATFNYIPVLNIFATLFSQIMFMHYILSQK